MIEAHLAHWNCYPSSVSPLQSFQRSRCKSSRVSGGTHSFARGPWLSGSAPCAARNRNSSTRGRGSRPSEADVEQRKDGKGLGIARIRMGPAFCKKSCTSNSCNILACEPVRKVDVVAVHSHLGRFPILIHDRVVVTLHSLCKLLDEFLVRVVDRHFLD